MNFTREPIIESVISPREGCKLVVRSSKTAGLEEYFVDSLEIVRFGGAVFFRSLERPKSFLVPVTDYEVLEVRETRMVLKVGEEKGAIKIGGGRSSGTKKGVEEPRSEKKRRRPHRRRKVKEEQEEVEESLEEETLLEEEEVLEGRVISPSLTSLLPPPKTLIRETISRYKEDESFKEAFYPSEEQEDFELEEGSENIELEEPQEEEAPLPSEEHEEGSPEPTREDNTVSH